MARKKKKKKVLPFIILLIILAAAAFVGYNSIMNYNAASDPDDTNYYSVTVKPGMTGKQIAEMLQNEGIIKDANRFRLRARKIGVDSLFQAGEYQLSPSMNVDEIYDALQHAKRETVSFTIPEGYYIRQVAAKLVSDGLISSEDEFYKACEEDYDYWFIPQPLYGDPTGTVSPKANRLEGYLFPDTYEVFKNATAHEIINKMLGQFDTLFDSECKAKAEKMGYSVQEIVTIASMIERESRADSERPKIASVIYNRLNIGMQLQIDACIQYCLGEQKDRVLYSDLEMDSPYNTYKVSGLPAGPIASPGKASIEAALNPDTTDYIYYVLKNRDSIEHNFAVTAAEFNTYKQQYINSLK